MFFGKALWVNLSDGRIEERDLPEELFAERIGGAAISSSLMNETKEGCISIGSGPLTGAPCPGGSAAIAGVCESDGSQRFAPILLNAGLEFKLSGFDFVVIEGKAESPVYLWIRDQVADIIKCEEWTEDDSWKTYSRVQSEQGDPRIQVLTSSMGDCASLGLTSGWDRIGLGTAMRSRKLKAIAFRGLGELEIEKPEEFLAKGSEMMRAAKNTIGNKAGITSLLKPEAASRIKGSTRNRACFSCPFPCLSYAGTGTENPEQILLMDQISMTVLAQLPGSDDNLIRALARLHREGKCANEQLLKSELSLDEIANGSHPVPDNKDRPKKKLDTITEGIEESEEIAAGYILGICPRYIGIMKPDLEQYCAMLSQGTGKEISKENILELGSCLLKQEK